MNIPRLFGSSLFRKVGGERRGVKETKILFGMAELAGILTRYLIFLLLSLSPQ